MQYGTKEEIRDGESYYIISQNKRNEIETIAAHHDGIEWTDLQKYYN